MSIFLNFWTHRHRNGHRAWQYPWYQLLRCLSCWFLNCFSFLSSWVWFLSRSKRRAAHWISLGEQVMKRKSQCIAKHHASSCSNFHRVKMYILWGKIFWLKFALIEATNFISRRFGLMTFFKTVCFHTGQDKNLFTTKGWWKLRESFHPPFTLEINYIKWKEKIKGQKCDVKQMPIALQKSSSIIIPSASEMTPPNLVSSSTNQAHKVVVSIRCAVTPQR